MSYKYFQKWGVLGAPYFCAIESNKKELIADYLEQEHVSVCAASELTKKQRLFLQAFDEREVPCDAMNRTSCKSEYIDNDEEGNPVIPCGGSACYVLTTIQEDYCI